MAYAAYGAATALTPALLIAVTPSLGRWPSFALAVVARADRRVRGAKVRAVRRAFREFACASVYPHALWAFGLLCVTGGIIGFRANSESLIRIGLIVVGIVLMVVFF